MNEADKQAQNLKEQEGNKDFYQELWNLLVAGDEEAQEQEAKNAVQDRTGYIEDRLAGQGEPARRLVFVGAPGSSGRPPALGNVSRTVQDGPRKLWELLQNMAHDLLPVNRETRRKVAVVVYEVPIELLALHLGVHPDTVRRWKLQLMEEGLLDARFRVVNTPEGTRRTGTVWAVPLRPKVRPKVDPRDFPILPSRNLWQDKLDNKLSYQWVKRKQAPSYETLLLWAKGIRLVPKDELLPLETIFTLSEMDMRQASRIITLLSMTLAHLFNDPRSRRFFAGVLWQVHRGQISATFFLGLLNNLLEGFRAGEIEKPGAVLAATFKKHGFLGASP